MRGWIQQPILLKELIHVTKNGFDRLEKKQDETISKIDQSRIEITSEVRLTRNELGDKIDSSREEITSEIRSIRDDFRTHIDERLAKVELELSEIKAKVATLH